MQIWLKNWVLRLKIPKNTMLAYKLLLKEFLFEDMSHVFPSYAQKCGFLRLCKKPIVNGAILTSDSDSAIQNA